MGERGDDGEMLFRDLRDFGVSEAEIADLRKTQQHDARPPTIDVEPENHRAVRMFMRARTQWRGEPIVVGKSLLVLRSGLDYAALPTVATALGYALDEALLDGIQIMEGEALLVHTRQQEAHLRRR